MYLSAANIFLRLFHLQTSRLVVGAVVHIKPPCGVGPLLDALDHLRSFEARDYILGREQLL